MITLAQKIADIKILLARLEKGWKEKNIFAVEGVCEYNYPNNESGVLFEGEVDDGWQTIIWHMADLLGFNDLGLTEDRQRSILKSYFSEQDIWNLMYNAKAFIELIETPQVKKRVKRIKIS